MEPADNPYRSPVASDAAAAPQPRTRGSWRLVAGWCGAVAANLVFPLMVMPSLVRPSGYPGVALGVLGVVASGAAVVRTSRMAGLVLTRGGYLGALTQVMSILHLFAGMLAVSLAERLGLGRALGDPGLSFAGALVASFVAGALIMSAGAILGVPLRLVTPAKWWNPGAPDEPVAV